jgi:hypothetical protein
MGAVDESSRVKEAAEALARAFTEELLDPYGLAPAGVKAGWMQGVFTQLAERLDEINDEIERDGEAAAERQSMINLGLGD